MKGQRMVAHSLSGYINRRCRCDVCRAAWASYRREYRKTRRRLGKTAV